ncbi:mechanosensitive ion channel domain-containing protein [Marinobacterium sediminicola]|uniref:Small-conductance mechanosensitive channel n=1 Tax=Marinobacterium sediminicola TaxID=518898 RepID=A0ABY1RWV4_9GAMM|nr:mechanosensitive ion channel domain-containing protein [Marinobacterium sediminicola]ULG67937.1 mechanosensitive ion channel family protein [Marinobacterium sediminicola]SMR71330.1 Mechanosensitive ion channel [Marinobacterium sediminicola]
MWETQLTLTAVAIGALFAARWISSRILDRIGLQKQVANRRLLMVKRFFGLLQLIITVMLICIIWGVDYAELMILFSSAFAVIGVALFAQWSILSNITGSIIIFFAFPYRIGDRIKILDKDDDITGVITEISLFHLHIQCDNGETIHYPNNLVLQKAVRRLSANDPAAITSEEAP